MRLTNPFLLHTINTGCITRNYKYVLKINVYFKIYHNKEIQNHNDNKCIIK